MIKKKSLSPIKKTDSRLAFFKEKKAGSPLKETRAKIDTLSVDFEHSRAKCPFRAFVRYQN